MATISSIEELTVQTIFVDDRSTDGTNEKIEALCSANPSIQLIKLPKNSGAGQARNIGLTLATGKYVLFFDADDVLYPEIVKKGVLRLNNDSADIAMFPYLNERAIGSSPEAMHHTDVKIWDTVTLGQTERSLRLDEAPSLLEFTNYPWNKIFRTEMLRRSGFRFGTTLVHNDIEAHWRGLIAAQRIILINEPICRHIVLETGINLTNIRDRKRLAIFEALENTYHFLCDTPHRARYAANFWRFAVETLDWARSRISTEMQPLFDLKAAQLFSQIDLIDYDALRRSDQITTSRLQTSILSALGKL